MTRKNYLIAKELKRKLSAVTKIIDFRVFGSMARGNEDKYSDMDIFLKITSINKAVKEKILDVIWEVGFKHFIVISPVIFMKKEIENSPLRSAPLVKNISEEGIKI